MNPNCQQCGHPIDGMIETVQDGQHTYFLHRGGCVPGSYDRWQPTRRCPR